MDERELKRLALIGIRSFNEKRPELAEFFIGPEFQFNPFGAVFLGGKTYVGLKGLWEYKADITEAFEKLVIVPTKVVVKRDVVLIVGTFEAQGKSSDIKFEAPYAGVAYFRDGLAISLKTYFERAEGLEAAGVTEDDVDLAEPLPPEATGLREVPD